MKILLISQSKRRCSRLQLLALLIATLATIIGDYVISAEQQKTSASEQQVRSLHQSAQISGLNSRIIESESNKKRIVGDILPGRTLQREDLAAFQSLQQQATDSKLNANKNQNLNRFNSFASSGSSVSNANSNQNRAHNKGK